MKQFITSFFLFCSLFCFSQNEVIKKAQNLIEEKKYESAFKILDDADPNNEDPDIVIEKSILLMDYFVMSMMHQMFSLKDIEPDEDIMDYRGKEGVSQMFAYNPEESLTKAIEKKPDNYHLYKTLGYYYHEVHLKYRGNWLKPDSTLINLFIKNYKLAYENGVYDDWSLYGIGYGLLYSQDFEESIKYFKKAIELNSDYPSSHYNLAYAYLSLNQRENAIESAKRAFELYNYPVEKADAARIVAVCYEELKQFKSALEYYKKSNEVDHNNYYTLRPLLSIEINLNKENYKERTKEFFLLAPANPTIYQNLMEMYWANEKQNELIHFLEDRKSEYKNDQKVTATLYFYIAKIQYDSEDFEKAKSNFETAKSIFKNVFEPGHRVFEAIDSYLKDI